MGNNSVVGARPNLVIGGMTFTDLDNLIVLTGSASASKWSTLRKQGTTVGYAVTAGKTLKVYAVQQTNEAASSLGIQLSQSDNDTGHNGTTAQTNAVPLVPTTVTGGFAFYVASAAGAAAVINPLCTVAATKYLTVLAIGAGTGDFLAYCYES